MNFWDSFWPNLASTVVGIIIGLPAAWGLERLIDRRRIRQESTARAASLRTVGKVLAESIRLNRTRLERADAVLAGEHIPLGSEFDLETWHALKGRFVDLSSDILLQARAAEFFSGLSVLAAFMEKLFRHSVGVEAAMPTRAGVVGPLRNVITKNLPVLRKEATELIELLESLP